MDIHLAKSTDAKLIHNLMIKAFMEIDPPSSALEETVQTISLAIEKGEKALVAYEDNNAVGMVRFQITSDGVYFYRLSVIPEKRGKGIAKKILQALEDYAKTAGANSIFCRVRMELTKNVQLYSSIGFYVSDEEVVHKPNGLSINVVLMKKEL